MKEFKASPKLKAKVDFGDKSYEFYSPTIEQLDNYRDKYKACEGDMVKITDNMMELMASLGKCDKNLFKQMDNTVFWELFSYLIEPEKKT
jgi:hypothetical protein